MTKQHFGDDFKKLCEFRHKWDDGWVCSKCGVRKADWVEADIKNYNTRGAIMSGYAKGIKDVLEDCERALQSIQACVAYDGTICKPNQSDLCLVAIARDAIREYCRLRDIKLFITENKSDG